MVTQSPPQHIPQYNICHFIALEIVTAENKRLPTTLNSTAQRPPYPKTLWWDLVNNVIMYLLFHIVLNNHHHIFLCFTMPTTCHQCTVFQQLTRFRQTALLLTFGIHFTIQNEDYKDYWPLPRLDSRTQKCAAKRDYGRAPLPPSCAFFDLKAQANSTDTSNGSVETLWKMGLSKQKTRLKAQILFGYLIVTIAKHHLVILSINTIMSHTSTNKMLPHGRKKKYLEVLLILYLMLLWRTMITLSCFLWSPASVWVLWLTLVTLSSARRHPWEGIIYHCMRTISSSPVCVTKWQKTLCTVRTFSSPAVRLARRLGPLSEEGMRELD